MIRRRVFIGSLLGAALIHVMFIACYAPPASTGNNSGGDSGVVSMMMDVLQMETRDANAQDATSGQCSCPSPPVTVFSAAVDGTCNIARSSSNWITTCSRQSAGVYSLAINGAAGLVNPVCVVTAANGYANVASTGDRLSVVMNPGADGAFFIMCQTTR